MAKHFKEEKKTGFFGTLLKFIGTILLIVVLLVGGMIGFLSATEFKPDDAMAADVEGTAAGTVAAGDKLRVVSWNIGYGALGDNADFFMDGGKMVNTADESRVNTNMEGIISELSALAPDIFFLQEADKDSSRSHHINELALIQDNFADYCSAFANNFKVAFLPYPVPPIGKVDSGIATFSRFAMADGVRYQLPIPFSWPIRMANLKRCVLETRIPVEGTDKELVLLNLHLEAYDDGSGKLAQTKALEGLLLAEQAKGNYIIAGGDFNQIFSNADTTAYPAQEGKWQAGEIDITSIEGNWQFLMDSAAPSCRSLDKPYAGADAATFQYYLIDGFIVSDNIKVNKVENQNIGFVSSDHNPVLIEIELNK
ncbi:MAG: endonuclease/exonuclease/phosphatase family protein [Mogibacterium sp.]|nr:endonuclease/exonuclease/phosphatase family protein [Mogibacterium sp.]